MSRETPLSYTSRKRTFLSLTQSQKVLLFGGTLNEITISIILWTSKISSTMRLSKTSSCAGNNFMITSNLTTKWSRKRNRHSRSKRNRLVSRCLWKNQSIRFSHLLNLRLRRMLKKSQRVRTRKEKISKTSSYLVHLFHSRLELRCPLCHLRILLLNNKCRRWSPASIKEGLKVGICLSSE